MAIIAALHDPLAVLLTDDLADVVTPHDDGTHRRAARVAAIVSPRSGKVVLRTRIAPNLRSHVPAAPRGWPAGVRGALANSGDDSGAEHEFLLRRSTRTCRAKSFQPRFYAYLVLRAVEGRDRSMRSGVSRF